MNNKGKANEVTREGLANKMIGNKFWQKRSKSGRDKIFSTPLQLEYALVEYCNYTDSRTWDKQIATAGKIVTTSIPIPYTIQGFTAFIHVNTQYLSDFEKAQKKVLINEQASDEDKQLAKDFSLSITHIRETISQQKIEGATVNDYNPMLVSRLEGLKDTVDNNVTGAIEHTVNRIVFEIEPGPGEEE